MSWGSNRSTGARPRVPLSQNLHEASTFSLWLGRVDFCLHDCCSWALATVLRRQTINHRFKYLSTVLTTLDRRFVNCVVGHLKIVTSLIYEQILFFLHVWFRSSAWPTLVIFIMCVFCSPSSSSCSLAGSVHSNKVRQQITTKTYTDCETKSETVALFFCSSFRKPRPWFRCHIIGIRWGKHA